MYCTEYRVDWASLPLGLGAGGCALREVPAQAKGRAILMNEVFGAVQVWPLFRVRCVRYERGRFVSFTLGCASCMCVCAVACAYVCVRSGRP